ncbi:MAG: hypothetical protein HQK58_07465 [Deltaproteobacteria bacterium]|nr:hypothetical protein [Deltaproteobacteria bacterium]
MTNKRQYFNVFGMIEDIRNNFDIATKADLDQLSWRVDTIKEKAEELLKNFRRHTRTGSIRVKRGRKVEGESSVVDLIVKVVGKHSDGAGPKDVVKETGMEIYTVNYALSKAHRQGRVQRISRGVYVISDGRL